MKFILRFAVAAAIALAPIAALAQPALNPIAPGNTPITVAVPQQGGGVINIGQVFGPIVQPYVDSLVQALLAALTIMRSAPGAR